MSCVTNLLRLLFRLMM